MTRPARVVACLPGIVALIASLALLWGCGGDGGSSEAAQLEQARREGAVAAHHADQIRQLQKEVTALKHERATATDAVPQIEAGPEAADVRIPESGTYSGEARQRGAPTNINKDYPVQMSFSSTGSQISYPALGCAGELRPVGFDGSNRVYEEQITSGHCDDGGTWLVHVDGPTTLEAAWSLPSASYTVTATLVR